jgi:ADP-heptose:LPS heptosyltransferase
VALTAADAPVLVLRALGLGDALTGVPALRGLRRALPGRPLVLAATGAPAHLLRALGVVDAVVPTRGLDAAPPGQQLGPGRHDAVNLHGSGPQSHRLLLAGRPASLLAFASSEAAVAGPPWREDEHEVRRWCRLVGAWGADGDPQDLRLTPPVTPRVTGHRRGPVVVHPGAASGSRRWPVDRFAAVTRRLRAAGHPVVVTGSTGESTLCRRLIGAAGLPAAADLSGRLPLPALTRLMAAARLLICGDTGVAHLGTAFGTPSVLLFGPTPPSRWGPLVDHDRHIVLWAGAAALPPGDPHGRDADPRLARLTVDEVFTAAATLLTEPGASRAG